MAREVGIQKLGCLSARWHYFIFYSLFLPVVLLKAGVGLGAMDEASASSPAPMEPGVILRNYGKAVVGLAYPEPILQEMEKTPPSGEIFAPKAEDAEKQAKDLFTPGDAGYKYGHNYMGSLQFFYPWYAIRIFQTLFGDSSAFAVL